MDKITEYLDEHGTRYMRRNEEAFRAYVDYCGLDYIETAGETFEEAYAGQYNSEKDFAREMAESLGMIPPELPASYFNARAFANDLFRGDYYMHEDGFVFRYVKTVR